MTGDFAFARTTDPAAIAELVRRDGVAILQDCDSTVAAAELLPQQCLGQHLLAAAPVALVRDGGVNDRAKAPSATTLAAHSDGFSYGKFGPDLLGLVCVQASGVGGESFFLDSYALLDELSRHGRSELVDFLTSTPVEQTDPGNTRYRDTCVIATGTGRRIVRRFPFQAPDLDAPPAAQLRQQALLGEWAEVIDEAGAKTTRIKLRPGEVVWVDNYRVLHGRDPYTDPDRLLMRLWAWSTACNGLPGVELFSDSRVIH